MFGLLASHSRTVGVQCVSRLSTMTCISRSTYWAATVFVNVRKPVDGYRQHWMPYQANQDTTAHHRFGPSAPAAVTKAGQRWRRLLAPVGGRGSGRPNSGPQSMISSSARPPESPWRTNRSASSATVSSA